MHRILLSILLCWITCLLLTCKPEAGPEAEEPLPNDGPRIQAIRFPGIADQDVQIDQRRRLITIRVPPLLPPDVTPSIQTPARVRPAPWLVLFQTPEAFVLHLTDTTVAAQPTATYRFRLIATGPQQVGELTDPLSYTLVSSGISLPLIHLYANGLPMQIRLTAANGQTFTLQDSGRTALFRRYILFDYPRANRIMVDLHRLEELAPGVYQVALLTQDNRWLQVPQPLTVAIGRGQIDALETRLFFLDGTKTGPGLPLDLTGYNLFQEEIQLSLSDSSGSRWPVTILGNTPNGRKMTIQLPTRLQVGMPYVLHFQQKAQPVIIPCYLLRIISRTMHPLTIGAFNDGGTCSLQGPDRIRWGYSVTPIGGYGPTPMRYKFVPLAPTGVAAYYLPLSNYDYRQGTQRPEIFIPRSLPLGFYRVYAQSVSEAGQVLDEGPAFWRLVEVY